MRGGGSQNTDNLGMRGGGKKQGGGWGGEVIPTIREMGKGKGGGILFCKTIMFERDTRFR